MSKPTVRAAFVAVTMLFFAWGFITSLIDPLVAAVKGIFTLTNLEAQLSAFAFFIAYGLVSFPAAVLIARIRAVPAILLALAMMAIACLIMLGAANLAMYSLVLLGLFVLASGITDPAGGSQSLAAALGDPAGSHFRLTLSADLQQLRHFLGPLLGAALFLKGVEVKGGMAVTEEARSALAGIDRAYFWVCGLILLLLAFFFFSRRDGRFCRARSGTRQGRRRHGRRSPFVALGDVRRLRHFSSMSAPKWRSARKWRCFSTTMPCGVTSNAPFAVPPC